MMACTPIVNPASFCLCYDYLGHLIFPLLRLRSRICIPLSDEALASTSPLEADVKRLLLLSDTERLYLV